MATELFASLLDPELTIFKNSTPLKWAAMTISGGSRGGQIRPWPPTSKLAMEFGPPSGEKE